MYTKLDLSHVVHGPDKNVVPPRGTKAHMFFFDRSMYVDNVMR